MGEHGGDLMQQSSLVIKQRNLARIIVFRAGLYDLGLCLVQLRFAQLDD